MLTLHVISSKTLQLKLIITLLVLYVCFSKLINTSQYVYFFQVQQNIKT